MRSQKKKKPSKGRRRSLTRKKKRAMAAAWSDEDVSSSESSAVEEVGLMADFEVTSSPFSFHSSTESKNSDEEELSHEELVESLFDVCSRLKSVIQEKEVCKNLLNQLFLKKRIYNMIFQKLFQIKRFLRKSLRKR